MIITCQAILFDLDGVLVDSTPSVTRVWSRWAVAQGLSPDLVVAKAHGRRSIETIRAVTPHLDAELENVNVEQMEIEDRDGVAALPGAAEILRELASNRMAIVTSATRRLAVARMGYAGLPVPANMITANDVVKGKPYPEPYLRGAALLGFAPGDCVVVEDAPAGIEAARKAGMRIIALQTTHSDTELEGSLVIVPSLDHVRATSTNRNLTLDIAIRPPT